MTRTKAGGQTRIERVDMTRELAEKLLSLNTHNRNIRERVASGYAKDMLNGRWVDTGDTIKVSDTDALLDGQHRILGFLKAAEVKPELKVPMWIAWDLDESAQDATDAGARRKLADVLKLRKPPEHNPYALASILRLVNAWMAEPNKRSLGQREMATNATLLELLREQPVLRDVASQALSDAARSPFSASVLGLTRWLLSDISEEDTEKFFELLVTQEGLGKGHPIFELAKAGRRIRDDQSRRRQAYPVALILKAWNLWRQGQTVEALSFRMGGANPERFPEPM